MRRFGKIVVKPNKSNPKYIEASYPTPVDAFGQWPGLAARQTTTFPLTPEGRDDAAAWLSAARKRIDAGVWQPERIIRRREREKGMTFAEFVDKWNRVRLESGVLHEGTTRLSEYYGRILCRRFGHMVLDRIGPKDIEAYDQELAAETTDHERRVRLLYLRQILAAAAKPDADGHSVIKRSPFDVRIPPVRRRSETEPATAEELRVIHDSMPRHLRLAITLAIAAGGLRIGEVCGLQTQGHRPRPQAAVRAAFRDAGSGRSGRIPARRDEDPGKPPSRTHPRTGLPPHQGTYRQVLPRQGSRHDALPRGQAPGTGPEPDDDPTAVPHREEKNQPRGRDVPLPARDARDDVHDPGRHAARDHGRTRPRGRRRGRPMLPTRGAETQARRRREAGTRIPPRRGSGRHQGAE